MGQKSEVVFSDTGQGIEVAVRDIFEHFGGGASLLKSSGDVYLKVNTVDLKPYSFTDPEVVREVIRYFQRQGARDIYVIENCTQSNFTRLVFTGTGMSRVCRETGAIPVYLDETGVVPIYLEGLQTFNDISSFVFERLIEEGHRNLYVSLPKLKTHSMSQVTLSIKNQFGLIHQQSRIADHNFRLHRKFADIYRVIRPDFVVIDGLIATNHGHYIAEKNTSECVVPMNCLIGGRDPLSVDIVAAAFLGFAIDDVEHLRLAAETGIGESDMDNISIINREIFEERKKNLTCELLDRFPPELVILRGKERCCNEGCRRNTETVVEVFYCDHNGKGGFTILMGKGIDPAEVRNIQGPVHIAGSCAIQEHGMELVRRLGKKKVTMSPGCNNLAETVHALCRHMGVAPLKLAAVNPVSSLSALITARLKGTRAIIPPIF
ncbi:MAG: DUF362 domain-containing protein [Deltaproteobacteria bacterium]|nr:DUF362 domain-containing protein [Deltaproteobacteria bacterium]